MQANFLKIGMREFRAHLPQYLIASSPIAITKYGETVGFYIPTSHHPEKASLEALKRATVQLENLLQSHKIGEDELFTEYRLLKKQHKNQ